MAEWRHRFRPIAGLMLMSLSLGLGYQNCAPQLPGFDADDFKAAPTRPTPNPGSQSWDLPSTGGDGSYSAPEWEGVCTNSDPNEPMIINTGATNPTGYNVFFRRNDGAIAIWNMASNRINQGVVCRMNGSGWVMRAAGDFNGDRAQDVIWRNADGRNAIWLMQGALRASGGMLPSLGPEWHIEGTGDFNGDGKSDILWVNWQNLAVMVWAMNGTNVVSQTILGGYSADFHIVDTGDFNGDRITDVLFRNNDGVTVIWFVANPSQVSLAAGIEGNLDNSWRLLGGKDVDGDGKADLVWMNNGTRSLKIAKMDGYVTKDTRDTQPVPSNLNFVGMADISQDGRSDMLFMIDNNAFGAWFMNFIPQTGTSFGAVPSGWSPFSYEHR